MEDFTWVLFLRSCSWYSGMVVVNSCEGRGYGEAWRTCVDYVSSSTKCNGE